jgi:16S rRNA (cytidine1402-2'-O)-methyltransferase
VMGYVFYGFLPARAKEREAAVIAFTQEARTIVVLETPHRIEAAAAALAALGSRLVTVGRELTKQFEEIATMPASTLLEWFKADNHRTMGEFALAIHPTAAAVTAAGEGERVLGLLLPELPTKSAVKLAADITGEPRNALYATALLLKNQQLSSKGHA